MRIALLVVLSATPLTVWAQEELAAPAGGASGAIQQRSYALGVQFGKDFRAQGVEINPRDFLKGLSDALAGAKLAYSDAQMTQILQDFEKELMAKQAARARALGKTNQDEGTAFLAANAKKDGVRSTQSGLQYKVVKAGNGPKPKATDTVRTHYEGRLIDGTVFDSSYERQEPAVFPVRGVIPGWTEALQLMPVGSKWQLYIPAKLAYGERGAGADIGPNATLIFDIELLGIEPPQ